MIFVYFDKGYMRWARTYLRSIDMFEPLAKIYIRSFNLKNRDIEELKKYNKNIVRIKNTIEDVRKNELEINPYLSKGRGRHPLETTWMIQIISQRYQFLIDAMDEFSEEKVFIHSDVDMFAIRPFIHIFEKIMENVDVGLFKQMRKQYKINATLMLMKNNECSRKFLKACNEYIDNNRPLTQGNDQRALKSARAECHDWIKIKMFPRRHYVGYIWTEDMIFWDGARSKGGSKDANIIGFEKILKELETEKTNIKSIVKKYRLNRGGMRNL